MKLIVAVSGGVDSMVMLDQLVRRGDAQLIVAHIDHGIRDDGDIDAGLVKDAADEHGLDYVTTSLSLGPDSSEESAREARHDWLRQVQIDHEADAIATAHHQDDVIETMVINMIRGTGWRGLCSLRETNQYRRPLIATTKADIVRYAIDHGLDWREDVTNDDLRYLRNRVRYGVVARMNNDQRQRMLQINGTQIQLRDQVTDTLTDMDLDQPTLQRQVVTEADVSVAREILRHWLGQSYETRRLDDLRQFAQTARNGALWSLDATRFVRANRDTLIVTGPDD